MGSGMRERGRAGGGAAVELHQRAAVPAGHRPGAQRGGARQQPLPRQAHPLAHPPQTGTPRPSHPSDACCSAGAWSV